MLIRDNKFISIVAMKILIASLYHVDSTKSGTAWAVPAVLLPPAMQWVIRVNDTDPVLTLSRYYIAIFLGSPQMAAQPNPIAQD